MEAIARRGNHQHLIIESTGISDPMPVAEALVYSDHDDGHDEEDADSNGDVVAVVEGGVYMTAPQSVLNPPRLRSPTYRT